MLLLYDDNRYYYCVVFIDISIRKWSALICEQLRCHAYFLFLPMAVQVEDLEKYSFVMKENYATNVIYELFMVIFKLPCNFSQTTCMAPLPGVSILKSSAQYQISGI